MGIVGHHSYRELPPKPGVGEGCTVFQSVTIPQSGDGKTLSEEELDQLCSAYVGGATVRELVDTFGIGRTTVLDHLKRQNIPRRAHKRKLTDAKVSKALQLYRSGMSMNEIARRYQVDSNTSRKEFRKLS